MWSVTGNDPSGPLAFHSPSRAEAPVVIVPYGTAPGPPPGGTSDQAIDAPLAVSPESEPKSNAAGTATYRLPPHVARPRSASAEARSAWEPPPGPPKISSKSFGRPTAFRWRPSAVKFAGAAGALPPTPVELNTTASNVSLASGVGTPGPANAAPKSTACRPFTRVDVSVSVRFHG